MARLIWLGTLGGVESVATGVSADGSVVVGWVEYANGKMRAFRWTAKTGMRDLGTLGGIMGSAHGVSADGLVVVGAAVNSLDEYRAFRWTAAGGMQDLGTLPKYEDSSWAWGVSADGSVVVGQSAADGGAAADNKLQPRAYRWTARTGMQELRALFDVDESVASGVSADGSVVVGWMKYADYFRRAFRWTATTGMQDLSAQPYGVSMARGVSADGSVVVGVTTNASFQPRAFRWTAKTGMQYLGTFGGISEARGVSANGSIVVGYSENTRGQPRAFRWTAKTGMQDLNRLYASLLRYGSVLWDAYAVSPNGRYIVGEGYSAKRRREAFLLDTLAKPSR
jgi:probable HAF family extracellular repeat protein